MFKEIRRNLRRLEANELAVQVHVDDEGFLDRQCPSQECRFTFKVHGEDWAAKVHEAAHCPFCGGAATSSEWYTQEHIDNLRNIAVEHVRSYIRRGRPSTMPSPLEASNPMRLRIECSQCLCRYAVIGAAFFCPACGYDDARGLFSRTIAGSRNTLAVLSEVRSAVLDRDTAENTVRSLLEHAVQNAVTAFQKYAEALYLHLVPSENPRRNAFQSLLAGSELWREHTGREYSDYLSADEMTSLTLAFQQRHLLAHTQGIVDQAYITNSGDTSYRVGQRIVITEPTVSRYLDVIQELADGIPQCTDECMSQRSVKDL